MLNLNSLQDYARCAAIDALAAIVLEHSIPKDVVQIVSRQCEGLTVRSTDLPIPYNLLMTLPGSCEHHESETFRVDIKPYHTVRMALAILLPYIETMIARAVEWAMPRATA